MVKKSDRRSTKAKATAKPKATTASVKGTKKVEPAPTPESVLLKRIGLVEYAFTDFHKTVDSAYEAAGSVRPLRMFRPSGTMFVLKDEVDRMAQIITRVSNTLRQNLAGRRWDSGSVEKDGD